MFCKKCILVNWGNVPNTEIEFGPVNLYSGGSGSGKTTAADALQSLMTAVHENLFMYNPGQDETTQRGRGGKQVRTLASYILGCDDGSYSRPRVTDGYVAAVFHPTTGEAGDRFTAIMGVRASLDVAGTSRQARLDDLNFFILPEEELSLSHFVHENNETKTVVPLTDLPRLLKKEYGSNAVEIYDNKKGAYLRRLYGALRGLKGAVSDREAKHAAKTFSNFMAYKPVKSINEFVAKEVLEPKDLTEDIKQVSELMRTIHSMEAEALQVQQAIEQLAEATDVADEYIQHWTALTVDAYAEASRRRFVHQENYLANKKQQALNHDAIIDTEKRLKNNKNKKDSLHSQLISLEAKRQGIKALKDKDTLEREVEQQQLNISEQVPSLLEQNHQFDNNLQGLKQLLGLLNKYSLGVDIPMLDKKEFRQSLQNVIDMGDDTGINSQTLLASDWVGIINLESQLESIVERETAHQQAASLFHSVQFSDTELSLRDQVLNLVNQRQNEQKHIQKKITNKKNEIRLLEERQVTYPPHVTVALNAIKQLCPQANPCVLCDYIEVIDPKWQMAIEGYLGGARFGIVVDTEYEAEAIRIVRRIKGSRNNAKVIQGAKARRNAARWATLPEDSIVEVMTFEHKIVEAYITVSYGNVIQVNDEETLSKTDRGVTMNGVGSGNYSMFRCDVDDSDLVFGQGARERALAAKNKQLDQLQSSCDEAEKSHRQIASLYDCINRVQAVECTTVIKKILAAYRELENAERALQALDLTDYNELEDALGLVRQDYELTSQAGDELQKKIGELNITAANLGRQIKRLADEQEELQIHQEEAEDAVLSIAEVNSSFDAEAALGRAEEQARLSKSDFNCDEQSRVNLQKITSAQNHLYKLVMEYNQSAQTHASIFYHLDGDINGTSYFAGIVRIKKDIALVYNRLKNNMLVDKYDQLSSLKESFNTAFVTNLCHSIYQSINEGKRILDDLSKELEHHRFGADQERFFFAYQWVPEFKEYHRFFKEVINTPNLGDGKTLFDIELSEKSAQVRDTLVGMLLENDSQSAIHELKRLSDYRHYRDYEIYKEPLNKEPIALSTYGTGSGGQLETPAYIIRSAAVTSAFKFNEGHTHCRMVLVDEAFSKMDEPRSREVIQYLTETLGLQLLFIMPTSKSGPFLDMISHQVVFSKCPIKTPIGELKTQVLVDRKACNTDKVKALWKSHRKVVRHQGTLDFMEEFIQP